MKIDYFLGVEPDPTKRMLLQPHFYKWYEAICPHVDSKLISISNGESKLTKVKRKILNMTALPLLFERRRGSILHVVSANLINHPMSFVLQSPLIITCFDAIIYESNAESLARKRSETVLLAHKRALHKADRVLTISYHARNRISSLLEIDKDKIDVVYLAVDHEVFKPRSVQLSAERVRQFGFEPNKRNILYVGSESPRKNLERMLHAISLVSKQLDIRFIKVGAFQEPYHSQLLALVEQLGIQDIVHFYGPVQMDHLPLLYNLADVFVFPSIYEGFGVPPLEAMASGCPVVTSTVTSLVEVVGTAAETVDPYDHNSIANGILKVLSDSTYCKQLVQNGIVQAGRFRWEETARGILNTYHCVV